MTSIVGKTARVTGKIGASTVGEVVVSVNRGTETFTAYPYDKTATFVVGDIVTVIEEQGRVVYVV